MKDQELHDLLYQALQTEQGGIEVYTKALELAVNPDVRAEWEEYLEQTRNHERVVLQVFETLGLDPNKETPSRGVVRHIGKSLVAAMELAKKAGKPAAAEIVAAECIVHAETKDHANWELLGKAAEEADGEVAD